MAIEFSNKGVIQFYNVILTDSAKKDSAITDMRNNFKDFLFNTFSLTGEQIDYINQIPDDITQNIGNNLAHGLENNYTINIQLGSNITSPNPIPYPESYLSCHLHGNDTHNNDCTLTHWVTLSCRID